MVQRANGRSCFVVSAFLWAVFVACQVLQTASRSECPARGSPESVCGGGWPVVQQASCSRSQPAYGLHGPPKAASTRHPGGPCKGCDDCCTATTGVAVGLVQMFRQDRITGRVQTVCSEAAVTIYFTPIFVPMPARKKRSPRERNDPRANALRTDLVRTLRTST